jgi:hypothetical protein
VCFEKSYEFNKLKNLTYVDPTFFVTNFGQNPFLQKCPPPTFLVKIEVKSFESYANMVSHQSANSFFISELRIIFCGGSFTSLGRKTLDRPTQCFIGKLMTRVIWSTDISPWQNSADLAANKTIGLYHPLDGITNLKYMLLCFFTPNKKIQRKRH